MFILYNDACGNIHMPCEDKKDMKTVTAKVKDKGWRTPFKNLWLYFVMKSPTIQSLANKVYELEKEVKTLQDTVNIQHKVMKTAEKRAEEKLRVEYNNMVYGVEEVPLEIDKNH